MDSPFPAINEPEISNPEISNSADPLLVSRIREGDERSWALLISKYEGRLHAFALRKLSDINAVDDVVQETFLGFHLSLPHFDTTRSIESYLFTICSHKITDHLRRLGRRVAHQSGEKLTLSRELGGGQQEDLPDPRRMVSSIHRSKERKSHEEIILAELLASDIHKWKRNQDWVKLACIELLFVSDTSNKSIAAMLAISEQKVANYKSDYLIRIKNQIAKR